MVEVIQSDREAAADFMEHKCLPGDLTPTNMRLGNLDDGFAVQAFARHRQQAERGEAWRPIEEAPRDEPILAALKVHHRNGDTWWERHVIVIDSETGTISDMDYHHGWEADDYQFWQPLPTPPETPHD